MHGGLSPGDVVRVRGQAWVLRALTLHASCSELELEPLAAEVQPIGGSATRRVVLLTPFDRPRPLAAPDLVRVVSRRAWMAGLRGAVLSERGPGTLAAALAANIDVLPHQLEPAIAVARHGATRLLLADAVGLGKTIEAALVLAELRARGVLNQALIMTPPGLRDQWAAELADRFAMEATVADAAWLRSCLAALPPSVNPWSVPGILVTSFDFAKRPEVRRGVEQVIWDAVVLDEAHLASGDSDRRAAVHAIACRSRIVLLLTATPHSGDARAFRALCGIGSLSPDDRIVAIRHDRHATAFDLRRRVLLRCVRGTAEEELVRRQLDRYVTRVWRCRAGTDGRDARLAMIVLLKRSFSGMAPLRRSLGVRLARLGATQEPAAAQLGFAWDDDVDAADEAPGEVLGAPGLDDVTEERAALAALIELARAAEAHDSKQRAVLRLLHLAREPAILFTEYRDTLESLHAALGEEAGVLHGGLDRAERAAVLSRFASGGLRVLLATDAAGVGLNLHQRCRLVVNLELPWNPVRLEQRIGRVDRIGQRRMVHAVNMVAGGTAESDVLARLVRRLDRARAAIGPAEDVLGVRDEDVVASQLHLGRSLPGDAPAAVPSGGREPDSVLTINLTREAEDQAARLTALRRIVRGARDRARQRSSRAARKAGTGALVTAVRSARLPQPLRQPGTLAVLRVRQPAGWRWAGDHVLVSVLTAGACPPLAHARDARDRAKVFVATSLPRLLEVARAAAQPAPPELRRFDRDAQLAACSSRHLPVQRGLFDRRAEREAEREAGREADVVAGRRVSDCLDSGASADGSPADDLTAELMLLLFITS